MFINYQLRPLSKRKHMLFVNIEALFRVVIYLKTFYTLSYLNTKKKTHHCKIDSLFDIGTLKWQKFGKFYFS